MAEDLRLRQKATQELLALSEKDIASLSEEDRRALSEIADGFEEELGEQGVPFYAEEAFTVLTLIEAIDADEAQDLEEVQEALGALKLAATQKIITAWRNRDKGFFIN